MALGLDKAHICLLSTKTISNDGGLKLHVVILVLGAVRGFVGRCSALRSLAGYLFLFQFFKIFFFEKPLGTCISSHCAHSLESFH